MNFIRRFFHISSRQLSDEVPDPFSAESSSRLRGRRGLIPCRDAASAVRRRCCRQRQPVVCSPSDCRPSEHWSRSARLHDKLRPTDRAAAGAAFQLLPADGRFALNVAAIDNADLAVRSLNESDWPLLGNIHGDYQSLQLKNSDEELRFQDERCAGFFLKRAPRPRHRPCGLLAGSPYPQDDRGPAQGSRHQLRRHPGVSDLRAPRARLRPASPTRL
jgi:hypothetical protein